MTYNSGKVLRRVFVATLALAGFAAVLGLAAKFWVIPALIRWQIRTNLAQVWRGEVIVGEVEFNFNGPVRIAGLDLCDSAGAKWIEVGPMSFVLGNWPSLSPVLRNAEIDGVRIRAHFRDGHADWPFKPPPPREKELDLSKYLDIQKITVKNISIGGVSDSGGSAVWDGLNLVVDRRSDEYHVAVRRRREDADDEEILRRGLLKGKGEQTSLELEMSRRMAEDEMAAVLGALGLAEVREATGAVKARVTFTGDFQRPRELAGRGSVELRDARVLPAVGPELRDVVVLVKLNGRSAEVSASATTCGGTLKAWARAQDLFSNKLSYTGAGGADALELRELSGAFDRPAAFSRGTAAVYAEFDGTGFGREAFRADVSLLLRGADLYSPPLMQSVLTGVELAGSMKLFSDLDGRFALAGDVATIEFVKMSNPINSVLVLRGGKVNLASGAFDVHVVVVPSEHLRDLATLVPGGRLITRLAESLSSFRVWGSWKEPDRVRFAQAVPEALLPAVRDLLGGLIGAGDGVMGQFRRLLEQGPLPLP
ncbi:MAG: hypothetical protein ACYTF6_09030 [Planctomycetota bacterium]|jgi:hypothetical protein